MKLPFSAYQKFVVAVLAFLQFTVVLDFMILSPLGALLMPTLQISPAQFGMVVSAYAFSAGLSGFLSAGFADKFDRKKLLLFFYCGFILGTLFCALAASYAQLLIARMITGVFGGVIGSITFAIATDLFPFEMRGRVMGLLQTAFAASQVLGIPAGLFLASQGGWHTPFLMIVAASVLIGIIIFTKLNPIDEHLKIKPDVQNPFKHLLNTISTSRYIQAFATTALLSTGGFMLMPFASAFAVKNVGISLAELPIMYMLVGVCAIFAGPLIGRFSDSFGKFEVFVFGTFVSIPMVWIYTHLGPSPLWKITLINSVLFVGIFSRMIPAQALMSAIPEHASRGAFMSISSSIQQVSGGIAAAISGMIVVDSGERLEHFNVLGYIVIAAALITLTLMWLISRVKRDD